jgi:hypothetical protein
MWASSDPNLKLLGKFLRCPLDGLVAGAVGTHDNRLAGTDAETPYVGPLDETGHQRRTAQTRH